jgi:hypothetical protein
VLTIIFFVSQIQQGLLQARNLSLLFDAPSGQLEEPLATDMKYDASHKHANYQDDCEAAPAGRICNCGYYDHFASLTIMTICLVLRLSIPKVITFVWVRERSKAGKVQIEP